MSMSKNSVCLALLIWAVITTFLLFIKRDGIKNNCDRCGERSAETKSTVLNDVCVHTKVLNATLRVPDNVKSPDRDRLFAGRKKETEERLVAYISKIFTQDSAYEKEGFTMIMLTYRREKVLPKLLLHYCEAKSLRRMIVIWNDVESQIPEGILALANKCQVTLQFIQEEENKLTNRFKPRPEILTDCKLYHNITSDIQGMVWGEPEREQLVAMSNAGP